MLNICSSCKLQVLFVPGVLLNVLTVIEILRKKTLRNVISSRYFTRVTRYQGVTIKLLLDCFIAENSRIIWEVYSTRAADKTTTENTISFPQIIILKQVHSGSGTDRCSGYPIGRTSSAYQLEHRWCSLQIQ